MEICDAAGMIVVEDCAHTMGASWNGVPSGRHGAVACYSTQTYKHMNSGEGGLLVSDDEDIAAKAVLLSGSYMLYERHLAAPSREVFERHRMETPNISGRMDNLRAAILRPQLRELPRQIARWNDRYRAVEAGLRGTPGLTVVERPEQESFVGSSIQFLLKGWSGAAVGEVLALKGSAWERNPPTLDPKFRDYSLGIYRLDDQLLVVLDVNRLLDYDRVQAA